jgi:hypothetical protein
MISDGRERNAEDGFDTVRTKDFNHTNLILSNLRIDTQPSASRLYLNLEDLVCRLPRCRVFQGSYLKRGRLKTEKDCGEPFRILAGNVNSPNLATCSFSLQKLRISRASGQVVSILASASSGDSWNYCARDLGL